MKNEVLCKVLAHNLCCLIMAQLELGVQPTFDDVQPKPTNSGIADLFIVPEPETTARPRFACAGA
jgi:hypothetical protein